MGEPFMPTNTPYIPILILFILGLILGFFLFMRNCCTRQLLSHHVQKKIARGGRLNNYNNNNANNNKNNNANNNNNTSSHLLNNSNSSNNKEVADYGSIAATRLFEDLYSALSRRKEKSGKPPRLPKAKKISILHNNLCTKVTQIEQTLPLHIRTHSTFPILSLIIQDYVVFVRSSLIPVTTKFIIFCNELTFIQNALTNAPLENQWQQVGTLLEEKIQWMARFAEEVLRNSSELQVMAHKMFRIINSMYEEMRMSSVTQNLASEASKTEYVFHLLSIYDSFKKMSIILQFARDEIDSTTFHLTQIQHLLENANYEQLEQTRVFRGEVAQILASDAVEQQQQAEALEASQRERQQLGQPR